LNSPVTEAQARQVGRWRHIRYRAWPTKRDYSFTFEHLEGGWRVYLDSSPDYHGRPSGSLESHRLDIGGRPYICWDRTLSTISEAQAVAALWADSTENYIATGRFEPARGRPQVQDRTVLNGYPASSRPAPPAPTRPAPVPALPAPARPAPVPAPVPAPADPAPPPQPRQSLWSRVKDQLFDY
jgi:hypothetical protein